MTLRPRWLCLVFLTFMAASAVGQEASMAQRPKLRAYTAVRPARDAHGNKLIPAEAGANSSLAKFNYSVVSSRDGNAYGVMVGQDPFGGNFTPTTVNAPVIPLIVTTNSIADKVSGGFVVSRHNGVTTFDPTVADNACLSAPNNVPLTLMQQSPIFQAANFKIGHTFVGKTQHVDAFQRGNFWQSVGGTNYHTLVSPQTLAQYPSICPPAMPSPSH
jgi:hypothetical protein